MNVKNGQTIICVNNRDGKERESLLIIYQKKKRKNKAKTLRQEMHRYIEKENEE